MAKVKDNTETTAPAPVQEARKGPRYLLPGNVEVWWGELSEEEKEAIREQYPAYKDVK